VLIPNNHSPVITKAELTESRKMTCSGVLANYKTWKSFLRQHLATNAGPRPGPRTALRGPGPPAVPKDQRCLVGQHHTNMTNGVEYGYGA
jgi:hypothetical protein